MNAQEQFWAGEFGNEYTHRNRVDWKARLPFWKAIIDQTGARSVFELGCNAGWNLSAIKRAYPDVDVGGLDINDRAIAQAQACGLNAWVGNKFALDAHAELVFTAGVLIHVGPEHIAETMRMIVDVSYDYVLAIEYASHTGKEESVLYRDNEDKLWRRNYGALYMDMGLELQQKGPAGKGFDNCTYWLLRKP